MSGDIFRNCNCIVLVYEISKRESFENISNWIGKCKKNAPKNVLMVLVGNKCDLQNERQVTTEEGEQFAKGKGMLFYETAAKTGENVENFFQKITKEFLKK